MVSDIALLHAPEPATAVLIALGGLLSIRRKTLKKIKKSAGKFASAEFIYYILRVILKSNKQ